MIIQTSRQGSVAATPSHPILLATGGLFAATLLLAAPASAQTPPEPHLKLVRDSLTTGTATGTPDGGTFSYNTALKTGTTIGKLTSSDATSNPNMMSLPDPANPSRRGSPSPGGLGSYTATYTVNGTPVRTKTDDPFPIPTFGMSCYFTALEADFGSVADNSCTTVTIKHHLYSGTVTDPDHYKGTFCSSFIGEIMLQGSGTTNAGQNIQYNQTTNVIKNVAEIHGRDGSAVIANQTVARSLSVIPNRGTHLNVDNIGSDLSANDTGGDVVGYRLDLYKGPGKAVCDNYNNIMSITSCSPRTASCPGYAFP